MLDVYLIAGAQRVRVKRSPLEVKLRVAHKLEVVLMLSQAVVSSQNPLYVKLCGVGGQRGAWNSRGAQK